MQRPEVIVVKGLRVLTSKQIANCYETTTDIIKKNFSNNRNRFIDGKHYISFSGDELKEFKNEVKNIHLVGNRASHLYLWTEKGALLHAKSLNTDKAWQVYDYLVDSYFRAKEEVKVTQMEQVPVNIPKGRQVVDVTENAQEYLTAIKNAQEYLTAIDIILQECNKYHCEENYMHLNQSLNILWVNLGNKILDVTSIEPNLITTDMTE